VSLGTRRPVALTAWPWELAQQDGQEALQQFWLEGEEAHHLTKVLRVSPGQALRLFRKGRQFAGTVAEISGKRILVSYGAELPVPPSLPVAMWFAIPALKGGHTEDLLRQLTEAGAAGFVLLEARQSVARWDSAKWPRLEKVLLEAAKQCGRADCPQLIAPTPLHLIPDLPGLACTEEQSFQWFLATEHLQEGNRLSRVARRPGRSNQPELKGGWLMACGPEGGWHPDELDQARRAGWIPVTLGPLVLRAETAPLIGCGAMLAAMEVA
jgi:16S rRNA (uracil1498-N3)-methyltransferase